MWDRQIAVRGGAVLKTLAGLIGVAGCLGAVAYAAVPRGPGDVGLREALARLAGSSRLGMLSARATAGTGSIPAPQITQHPNKVATSTSARFGFTGDRMSSRFQCRVDRRGWRSCKPPVVVTGLLAGIHRFSVRALDARGRRSPAARFRWRLLEPKDFSIQPQLAGLDRLYPGAPPVPLPLVVSNPNPVPIFVTSLQAAATADPQGCASGENLALIQASVSGAAPLKVPAGGSVALPTGGISAPAIQLRELPVNQDACQNAQFPLVFSGKARG